MNFKFLKVPSLSYFNSFVSKLLSKSKYQRKWSDEIFYILTQKTKWRSQGEERQPFNNLSFSWMKQSSMDERTCGAKGCSGDCRQIRGQGLLPGPWSGPLVSLFVGMTWGFLRALIISLWFSLMHTFIGSHQAWCWVWISSLSCHFFYLSGYPLGPSSPYFPYSNL